MSLNKKLLIIIFLPLLAILTTITITKILFFRPLPPQETPKYFLSPLPKNEVRMLTPNDYPKKIGSSYPIKSTVKKEVVGFLPFWLLDKNDVISFKNLTQVAYFGLAINPDGTFLKIMDDGTEEPGFNKTKSKEFVEIKRIAKDNNIKFLITLRLMETGNIEEFLANNNAEEKLINNTLEFLKNGNYDGINVDFEYEGSPENSTIKSFTKFVKALTEKIHKEIPKGTVSVSAYSDSAYKVRITEIWPLSQVVDHIIIMGYDFFRPSSETSGPVSPLTGSGKRYEYDITQTVKDYLRLASPEKIILGLPFYGYDWPVSGKTPYGRSIDFAALSSYSRTKKLLADKNLKENWDEISNTPYISYLNEEGINRQIFYDNEKSFGLKLDLINLKNLGGLAIWALGYEGENPEYWQTISSKFGTNL